MPALQRVQLAQTLVQAPKETPLQLTGSPITRGWLGRLIFNNSRGL